MTARNFPGHTCSRMMRCPRLLLVAATSLLLPQGGRSQVLDSLAVGGTVLDVDVYGNLFVLDAHRNLLTLYLMDGKQLRQVGGQGWGNNQFDRPSGLWARNGLDVFVADYGNHRIQRFDRTLSFVSSLFTRDDDDPDRRFGYPTDVALSRLGALFLCDTENARILKVSMSNEVEGNFGGYDAGVGRLYAPEQVEIGPNDIVYVLDQKRVVSFDAFGNFLHELASGLFQQPSVIFADGEGILVLDGDALYTFDREERPGKTVDLRTLVGGRVRGKEVRSLSLSHDVLYFLTGAGVYVVTNSGVRESGKSVDKEGNSH